MNELYSICIRYGCWTMLRLILYFVEKKIIKTLYITCSFDYKHGAKLVREEVLI